MQEEYFAVQDDNIHKQISQIQQNKPEEIQKINNNFVCLCKKIGVQNPNRPWLYAIYQKEKIKFPLKSLNHTVTLTEGVAQTTVEQVYKNEYGQLLEGIYKFQINDQQCYKSLVCEYDGKIIEGRIEEKQKARKEYQENKEMGNTVVLAEKDDEDENILKMQIGNIQPNTEIKITLIYFENLKVFQNKFYNYSLPYSLNLCSDHSIQNEQKQEQVKNIINEEQNLKLMPKCQFIVNSASGIDYFKSQNHEIIEQAKIEQNLTMFTLKIDNDKEISIFYRSKNIEKPKVIIGENQDKQVCAQLTFVPDLNNANLDDALKQCLENNSQDFDINEKNGKKYEITFVLDQSGSMGGQSIEKAKEALIFFLKSLPENCTFNIYSFGSQFVTMFKNQVEYNEKNVESAVNSIKKLTANMGGTEIFRPLNDIFKKGQDKNSNKNQKKIVYLLTDGAVRDENSVIQLIEKNNQNFNVHTIGIGNNVSKSLIKRAAEAGNGENIFIRDTKVIAGKIIELLDNSLSTLIEIKDIRYPNNLVETFLNPNKKLKMNQPFTCYLFMKDKLEQLRNQANNFVVNIKIFNSQLEQDIDYQIKINFDTKQEENINFDELRDDSVYYLGVNEQINQMLVQEEQQQHVKFQDNIVKLSVKNQVLSKYTAFICVTKYLKDEERPQVIQLGQKVIEAEKQVNENVIYKQQQQHRLKSYKFHGLPQKMSGLYDNKFQSDQKLGMALNQQLQNRRSLLQRRSSSRSRGTSSDNSSENQSFDENFKKPQKAINQQTLNKIKGSGQPNLIMQQNMQTVSMSSIQNSNNFQLSRNQLNGSQLQMNNMKKSFSIQKNKKKEKKADKINKITKDIPLNGLISETYTNKMNEDFCLVKSEEKEFEDKKSIKIIENCDDDMDEEEEDKGELFDYDDNIQENSESRMKTELEEKQNNFNEILLHNQQQQQKQQQQQQLQQQQQEQQQQQQQQHQQQLLQQLQSQYILSNVFEKLAKNQKIVQKQYNLLDLISSQSVKGFWNFDCSEILFILKNSQNFGQVQDNQVAKILDLYQVQNISLFEKIQEKNIDQENYANIWMTLFVLAWLEKFQAKEKSSWNLIAKKSLKWVNNQGINAEEYKNSVVQFL